MDNKKNKNIFQFIMIAVSLGVVLFGIGLTRAFMDSNTSENTDQKVSIKTPENVVLTYTDCASSNVEHCAAISASLSPGDSVTKTFEITNDTRYNAEYTLYFQELYNTFKNNDLVYKIENIETGAVLVEETPIPEFASLTRDQIALTKTINENTSEELKMTITFKNRDYSQNENLNAKIELKLSILKSEKNPVELITANVHEELPNFASVATTDEGVYAMEDNYGTSYYFRGAVNNNYVKFANLYWRIIRVNGDGSLRMIYDGTEAYANGIGTNARVALTDTPWNKTYCKDAKYVGYMFGGENGVASESKKVAQTNETNTTAKTTIEEWYKTNIEDTGYDKYLSDIIFCNDRTTADQSKTWDSSDTALGYGANLTMYGPRKRNFLNSTPTPSFICPENAAVSSNNDWFTAEATEANKGNGFLEYPVGLITIDEVVAAGGVKYGSSATSTNKNYYLYKGTSYWTFSPSMLSGNSYGDVFNMEDAGYFTNSGATVKLGIAPVINIAPEYATMMLGSGTMTDPYTIG